jgi:hypothetical protein
LNPITEITIAGGERYRVQGEATDIAALILDASRGSLMDFAWMTDAETGERLGFNPDHVVALRVVGS